MILAMFSFLSFLLGLLRDRLLAGGFGASNELDVYYVAFRIPDFIAMVLMTGAIGVAVIPLFTKNLVRSKDQAFSYLSNLLNISLAGLVIVCSILFIFTPQLMSLIAPGFSEEKRAIASTLTRIMFLSPILMGVSNIISAILRVFQRFLITSLAPVFYNLGSIIGIIFFVPRMGITGLAWGIVLGAVMHFSIQIPSLFKVGFKIKNVFNIKEKDFLQTIKLTIPRAIGLAATQINLVVVTIIGSTLIAGSVTVFSFANDLSLPIIGLVAVPFATAVFPALSLAYSKGEKKEMLAKFASVFRQIVFLIIPLSGIAFLLRIHLVRLVFGAGKFDWASVQITAACFGVFMLGLFAQGLNYLIVKAFYSIQNTRIPALVSILSVGTTALLAYFFVWVLGFSNMFSDFVANSLNISGMRNLAVVGLPLAISLDVILQMILLLFLLKRKIGDFHGKEIISSATKVVGATALTLFFTYFVRQVSGGYIGRETFLGVFLQVAIAGGLGFSFYLLASSFFGGLEVKSLKSFMLARLGLLNGKKTKDAKY